MGLGEVDEELLNRLAENDAQEVVTFWDGNPPWKSRPDFAQNKKPSEHF